MRLAERGDSPRARASATRPRIIHHPPGLSAAVYSPRAPTEGAPAVGASAADARHILRAEGCHGLVGGSAPGEDWAAAALAGVGSFVGKGLGLSGGEPYSFHGRKPPDWGVMISQLHQDFPPYFLPTVSGTISHFLRGKLPSVRVGGDAGSNPRVFPGVGRMTSRLAFDIIPRLSSRAC